MANYNFPIYEGGPDLFAPEGDPWFITDIIRGTQYQVDVVDFYIDEMNNGVVFFDGVEIIRQSNIANYDELQTLFDTQFVIE
jgi:hypothetical protein